MNAKNGVPRRLYSAAEAMDFLRDEHSCEIPHVATRFVLSHPEIACALLGMDNHDQLQQNVGFSGAPAYSEDQRARVHASRPDNPWVILPADNTGKRQK